MPVPNFQITSAITRALMGVEADRQAIIELPIDVEMLTSLRETARPSITSPWNRLTQTQVQETLAGARFPGRERDVTEVRNYYRAIEEAEILAQRPGPITEEDIRRIHGLVIEGRASPTPYRDGRNVISDSLSGHIVYLPPEASDVPTLMGDMVAWINDALRQGELRAPSSRP